MRLRLLGRLIRETYAQWGRDDGWLYAAAMAAFAALALTPLLIIALRVAESFGDERAVLHGLALVIDPIVGHGGVRALNGVISGQAHSTRGRAVTTALSIVIALFAGSRLFYALQRALFEILFCLVWLDRRQRQAGASSERSSLAPTSLLTSLDRSPPR